VVSGERNRAEREANTTLRCCRECRLHYRRLAGTGRTGNEDKRRRLDEPAEFSEQLAPGNGGLFSDGCANAVAYNRRIFEQPRDTIRKTGRPAMTLKEMSRKCLSRIGYCCFASVTL
jgi:hypothetical protein